MKTNHPPVPFGTRIILPVAMSLLACAIPTASAATVISTEFLGSEGYVAGSLDDSVQTGAPFFNETVVGSMYLPAGAAPTFGQVLRTPTASNVYVLTTSGTGSSFSAGDSWSVSSVFTFEGLPATAPGSTVFLPEVGFSTSSAARANALGLGIQKLTSQTTNYQLYANADGGGGFFATNFSYTSIGDDTVSDDDLTDALRLTLDITKSSTTNVFTFNGTLTNLTTSTTVASLSGSLTQSAAYSANLYGFFTIGSQAEAGNFDLLNVDSFTYTAVPEPSSALLISLGLAAGVIFRRRRISTM